MIFFTLYTYIYIRIKNVFKYEMGIDENDITEIIENCDWWINRIDKVENYKIELKKVK